MRVHRDRLARKRVAHSVIAQRFSCDKEVCDTENVEGEACAFVLQKEEGSTYEGVRTHDRCKDRRCGGGEQCAYKYISEDIVVVMQKVLQI